MVQLKEGLINLASLYSFFAPIALILKVELWKELTAVWVVLMAVALLAPPQGWMRPSLYSEIPSNRR